MDGGSEGQTLGKCQDCPKRRDRSPAPGYVLKSGSRWIDAPPVYGPRKTLYNRFVRWADKGIWIGLFLTKSVGVVAFVGMDHVAIRQLVEKRRASSSVRDVPTCDHERDGAAEFIRQGVYFGFSAAAGTALWPTFRRR